MTSIFRRCLLFTTLMFLLVACNPASTPPAAVNNPSAQALQVAADRAGLAGQLIDPANNQPMPNMVVRLAEVHWNADRSDGAVVLDEAFSPTAYTDAQGFFVFPDVRPGEYALAFGADIMDQLLIVGTSEGKARVLTLPAGQVLDIGAVRASQEG